VPSQWGTLLKEEHDTTGVDPSLIVSCTMEAFVYRRDNLTFLTIRLRAFTTVGHGTRLVKQNVFQLLLSGNKPTDTWGNSVLTKSSLGYCENKPWCASGLPVFLFPFDSHELASARQHPRMVAR